MSLLLPLLLTTSNDNNDDNHIIIHTTQDKDVGGGEGEGGHVYPVKQPLDLKFGA